jgi:hypothetical protein
MSVESLTCDSTGWLDFYPGTDGRNHIELIVADPRALARYLLEVVDQWPDEDVVLCAGPAGSLPMLKPMDASHSDHSYEVEIEVVPT